jgi:hypothetical protein
MKIIYWLSALTGLMSLTAQAGLYTSTDAGAIPQGGTTFSSEIVVSDISLPNPYVTSVNLVLTFNSTASLGYPSGSSTLSGLLTMGTEVTSPYASFTPVVTTLNGGQAVYNVTFATQFDGYNPNTTWGLVLWDTSNTGIENGLVGWSLNIEAVPEPANMALGLFGALAAGGLAWKRWRSKS